MGEPAWAQSDDFATPLSRAAHSAEMNGGIADWVRGHERGELYRRAKEEGATLAPFLSPTEIIADQHEIEREYLAQTELPNGSMALVPSRPFLMSQTPISLTANSTAPGAFNRAVYRELGLADSDIEVLASVGVI
jgi:crotonobetainyl-CoA:carnitine CoA-transferase CaiB-like acyl-CoA transferase